MKERNRGAEKLVTKVRTSGHSEGQVVGSEGADGAKSRDPDSLSYKLMLLLQPSEKNKYTESLLEAATCVTELNSYLTKRKWVSTTVGLIANVRLFELLGTAKKN